MAMDKRKNNRFPGVLPTVIGTLLILAGGAVFNFLFLAFCASPSQEPVQLDASALQHQAYIFTPPDIFSPYPWDGTAPESQQALTEEQRKILSSKDVPIFIMELLFELHDGLGGSMLLQEEILDAFQFVTMKDSSGQEQRLFLLDSTIDGAFPAMQIHAAVNTDGDIFSLFALPVLSSDMSSDGGSLDEAVQFPLQQFDNNDGSQAPFSEIQSLPNYNLYWDRLIITAKSCRQEKLLEAFYASYDASEFSSSTSPLQLENNLLLVPVGGARCFLFYYRETGSFVGFHLQT